MAKDNFEDVIAEANMEMEQELRDEEGMEDNAEAQRSAQQSMDMTAESDRADDKYSLFWKVLNRRDSRKVANLDKIELGLLDMPVRRLYDIAELSMMLGHPGLARWLMMRAEIVLTTSASKKGWFTELFVSHRSTKTREILSESSQQNSEAPLQVPKPKNNLFGRK